MKNSTNNEEVGRLITMVVVVTVIFLIFYGITLFVTRDKKSAKEEAPAQIQYDEILVGNLLEQPNSEYYVLVTVSEDKHISLYTSLLSKYKSQKDSIRYYTANLDNPFNTRFKDEKSELSITDIKDLKVSQSTLFKIKDKKITNTYEGKDKIKEHLTSIIKENTNK